MPNLEYFRRRLTFLTILLSPSYRKRELTDSVVKVDTYLRPAFEAKEQPAMLATALDECKPQDNFDRSVVIHHLDVFFGHLLQLPLAHLQLVDSLSPIGILGHFWPADEQLPGQFH